MRKLLYWLSGFLPCRIISDDGTPYLERYFLFQALGWTFYMHRFVGSDPNRGLHDHPYSRAYSFVLAGRYYEETRSGWRMVRWFNRLTGESFHRVMVPDGTNVWTLFCHGPYVKPWGFMRPLDTVAGVPLLLWEPHAYQTDEASGKQRWWDTAPHGVDEHRRAPG
jgi:hypothetical protein